MRLTWLMPLAIAAALPAGAQVAPAAGQALPVPALGGAAPGLPEQLAPPQEADPFYLPPAAREFVYRATAPQPSVHTKLQSLLRAIFRPRNDGGMGLVYDNGRTRTVAEVWAEGKANCLSLTAFFVMACRSIGIHEEYAEAVNTNHWRKVGSLIQFERHVVALTSMAPMADLIADFVPDLRKRVGAYVVTILPEPRFRALFFSNRAVEALTEGNLFDAKTKASQSLQADPGSSVGWNILGVVQVQMGDLEAAEASYRKAMALDPRDGAPLGNLEVLMRNQGRLEEAGAFRERAESVRRKDPYYHAYLAEEALGAGDLAEAATRIRGALKILPRDPDFLLLSARIKLAEGDLEGAMKGIEEARKFADPMERARYDSKLEAIQGMKEGKPTP
ncbi:tetratricopeptide repeat protein [Mesoterricola sediminis]|uniref:Tetratricopeptide repeat protein n=1 Tax=Mesoterricola sediminis TaxID=2927980 RepID=A0AA48GPR9_9BACT|nr:tetratricopeptide repeat protein [Mesoterricola sediminis]BDU75309.1 hypothetical protein METESE_02670 [Mesoterricola sediminis]